MGESNQGQAGVGTAVIPGKSPRLIRRPRQAQDISDEAVGGAMQTGGGRVHVVWDERSTVSTLGQLAYFANYLHETGIFDAWVQDCPLKRTSGNAKDNRDICGTWMLAALAGHTRYRHITALRSDSVAASVLGMKSVVSDDTLRRAIAALPDKADTQWLRRHLDDSVRPALSTPWILDIDTTIKPIYGHQEGAVVSYNPHKPGRASHALHTYWMSNLRLVLDVQVRAGDQHSATQGLEHLSELVERLPKAQRPQLVRGDCGFGSEAVMHSLEQLEQPYLFKLRQTKGIKRLLARLFGSPNWSKAGTYDQGWSAIEDQVQLMGWTKSRRVIVLRRAIKEEVALQINNPQGELALGLPAKDAQFYEYAVLITSSNYRPEQIAQLYRDRADCENGFDELKNQWGWGGFTTQEIKSCAASARAVALIYNWWSWYARSAKPQARMEAITSRPMLLQGVARAVTHAAQSTLYITPTHGKQQQLKQLLVNIRAALSHVGQVAQQYKALARPINRFAVFAHYVIDKILEHGRQNLPPVATVGVG